MTDTEREIRRLISYIRSCRAAGIDCTVTIDKGLTHGVLNALTEILQYRAIGTVEECREVVEKQRPKKPVIKPWSPALCPNCGNQLSESLGDGYYRHLVHDERCCKCDQKLDWSEEE